jgi:peptidoglycan hydrolase-like protein with peptidoglycan-binding domain
MSETTQKRFAEAHVYDLLTAGKLTQDPAARMQLQTQLAVLGYHRGPANGTLGPATEESVIQFASQGREHIVPRVNAPFEEGAAWNEFSRSHADVIKSNVTGRDTNSFLTQKEPLTTDEVKALQAQLKTGADGVIGPNTARRIIEHLKSNPAVFENINPALLKNLAERNDSAETTPSGRGPYNSRDELAAACRNSPAYAKITSELTGALKNDGAMGAEVYNAQIFLKAGGYYPGRIDATPGPGTDKAVAEFDKNPLSQQFDFKARQPFNDGTAPLQFKPPEVVAPAEATISFALRP